MKRSWLFSILISLTAVLGITDALAAGKPDTKAPTTTASPLGGTYSGSVTVSLTVDELATTYFCTGSACSPTTVYTGPMTFSTTTTLRYYSRDNAGNTETTKQQDYTIQPLACTPGPVTGPTHAALTWDATLDTDGVVKGYKSCGSAGCHTQQADHVLQSTHYQWKGLAPEMYNYDSNNPGGSTHQGGTTQGKVVQRDASGNIVPGTSALNAYCVNVLGNFPGACGSCHNGLGKAPTDTNKENIDCLLCHQKNYKRVKDVTTNLYKPDSTMCMTMDVAVQTIHKPQRENCLQCHAKAGGGDAVKRGDIALASGNTTDTHYDNHMATTGANLSCQNCHTFSSHRVAGRGTDLRPSDTADVVACVDCHANKATPTGHTTVDVNKHVEKVACQTCHIPTFAKNAADTAASEATEIHRDWRQREYNTGLARWEPLPTKQNNLKPSYRHWNGRSWGNNLLDAAVFDSTTGAYQISRPLGGINDVNSKLYPFKYKTADQPYVPSLNQLVAISTKSFFAGTDAGSGFYDAAVKEGLINMGLSATTPYTTVKADEFQVLNHQVPTASEVLQCSACHTNSTATQMKLTNMGYGLKSGKTKTQICSQCHADKKMPTFERLHTNHVHSVRNRDCSWCHDFTRAEEGYCAYPGPCG